jgi:hypothetical protein
MGIQYPEEFHPGITTGSYYGNMKHDNLQIKEKGKTLADSPPFSVIW